MEGERGRFARVADVQGLHLVEHGLHERRDPFAQWGTCFKVGGDVGFEEGTREDMVFGDVKGHEGEVELAREVRWVRGEEGGGCRVERWWGHR